MEVESPPVLPKGLVTTLEPGCGVRVNLSIVFLDSILVLETIVVGDFEEEGTHAAAKHVEREEPLQVSKDLVEM